MGRKPGKIDTPQVDPALEASAGTPDELDAFDSIDRLSDEMPGGAASCTVIVFKRSPDNQRIVRCKRFPLDKFDVDQLPVLFGGGDFNLRVIDAQGHHFKSFTVSFDPSIEPERAGAPAPAPAVAVPVPQGSSLTDQRFAQLEDRVRQSEERHTKFLESLITSGGVRGAAPSGMDQFTQVKQLLELAREVSGSRTPASEMGEVMRIALDFADRARGALGGDGEEKDGGFMGLIQDVLLPKLLENLSAGPRRAVARPATIPATAPAANPPARPPTPSGAAPGPALPPEWASFEFLRAYVAQFVDMAGRRMDPELVGQLAYQHVEDRFVAALEQFVNLPEADRHSILSQLDGRLVAYLPYLDRVGDAIKAEFESERTADDDVQSK